MFAGLSAVRYGEDFVELVLKCAICRNTRTRGRWLSFQSIAVRIVFICLSSNSRIRRIHIVFNILSGDRRDFIVDGADTVERIKYLLHKNGDAPRPDSIVLLFGGRYVLVPLVIFRCIADPLAVCFP